MKRCVRHVFAWLPVASALACGPAVRPEPMVEVAPREESAEVLVFSRDEKIPACPWEVIGTVSGEAGWARDADGLREAREEARKMGGQALLLASRGDDEAQVVRFLDPYSLCDPETGPTRP